MLDDAFLAGASVCRNFLHGSEVDRRWTDPSALPAMSTGALACHLSRQVTRAAELLVTASDLPVLASVDEHYAHAAWVTSTSPDDPENDRSTDDAVLMVAPAALRLARRGDDDLLPRCSRPRRSSGALRASSASRRRALAPRFEFRAGAAMPGCTFRERRDR